MMKVACIVLVWSLVFLVASSGIVLSSYKEACRFWGQSNITPIVCLMPVAVLVGTLIWANARSYEGRIYLLYNSGDYLEFGERTYKGWPFAIAQINPRDGRWEANPIRFVLAEILSLSFVALATYVSFSADLLFRFLMWVVRKLRRRRHTSANSDQSHSG